ncbi:ABC transporter permease [Arthrobacter sp. 179]|uniref:ABC transporter permease n=1 Tax=Arthrobacter sp. 179 TaxID=3457734 RepID=UPI0040346A19
MTVVPEDAPTTLHRVGARAPFFSYLRQAWERRDFAFEMARSRIQASNQRNRLGMLWIIFQPTMNALMYGAIFGLLQGDRRPPNFASFVVIGVFLFQFFTASMNQGAKSITGNQSLVQSLSFPRITLPLSTVMEQLLTLMPMLGVMFIYVMILGETPALSWLLIFPLVAILTVFNVGVALVAARLTVHIRDLTHLLPIFTRLLFYTSGVLFSVDRILDKMPWMIKIFDYHPLYQALQIARGAILDSVTMPSVHAWIVMSVWAVAISAFGVVFFWTAEERYGRDI